MRRWASLVICAVACAAAAAERPAVALTYSAAPPCPSEAEFRQLLAARLGFDPVADQRPDLRRADVVLEERDGAQQGRLSLTEPDGTAAGERTLTGADCAALAGSMAMALAIAIDPQLFARRQPAPPAPAAAAPEPVAAAPTPPAATAPTSFILAAGPRFGLGLLPAASGGAAAEGQLRRGLLSFTLGADGAVAASLATSGGEISASAFRASLGGCANVGPLAFCARTSAGVMRAEGSGFAGARRSTLPLWSLGPLVRAQLTPWSGLVIGLSAALDVALLRGGLTLGDVEVWRAAPVALDAGAFVGWSLL